MSDTSLKFKSNAEVQHLIRFIQLQWPVHHKDGQKQADYSQDLGKRHNKLIYLFPLCL